VDAHPGEQLAHAAELPVLRPEIVSPLADAVRFVHSHEADATRGEQRQERFAPVAHEPLGRDVKQAVAPVPQAGNDRGLRVGGKRAVVQRRWHAVADQGVDLVLHQRDQRRHYQREPAADERRRLEAQGLAAAGG
jgi:hypothetical protein